jgi:hypothetical protein
MGFASDIIFYLANPLLADANPIILQHHPLVADPHANTILDFAPST